MLEPMARSWAARPFATVERSDRAGLKVYLDGCSGCHGDYQKPSHWGTTAFYPRVPQFALNAPDRPDWQLFWIVKHGVRYSGMAPWDGEIPDEKIWQVVTFLSRLRNLPPDVDGILRSGHKLNAECEAINIQSRRCTSQQGFLESRDPNFRPICC